MRYAIVGRADGAPFSLSIYIHKRNVASAAADGQQAVGAVGGAAVVEVDGVAVGGLAVVAFEARGRGLGVCRRPRGQGEELVGVVALLEQQALGVGAPLGVVLHERQRVETPVGEGADDVDVGVEEGLLHGQAEVDPHVVGLGARVVAVPYVDLVAAEEGGLGDEMLGGAVLVGAQQGEELAAVFGDAQHVVHGCAQVAAVEVAEGVAAVEDVALAVAVGEGWAVVAAELEPAAAVVAAVLLSLHAEVELVEGQGLRADADVELLAPVEVYAVVGACKVEVQGGALLADAEAAREEGVAAVVGDGDDVVAGVCERGVAAGQGGAVVDVVGEGGEGGVVGVDVAFVEAHDEVLHGEAVGLPVARAVAYGPAQVFGLGAEDVELENQQAAAVEGEHGGGLFVAQGLRTALDVEFDALDIGAPCRVGQRRGHGVQGC